MSRLNVPAPSPVTHERGPAHATDSGRQLRRSVLTCLLWEDTFYETGIEIANRIAELVPQVEPQEVADLAIEARDRLQLRHVPLFLLRELARRKGTGPILEKTLANVIQRALPRFLPAQRSAAAESSAPPPPPRDTTRSRAPVSRPHRPRPVPSHIPRSGAQQSRPACRR